jgi:hypothetical protein
MTESSNKDSMSRRELLRLSAFVLPSLPLMAMAGAAIAQAPAAKAPPAGAKPAAPACNPVPETDPVAKAIKYVADGSKVTNRPAKMGVEGKNQNCENCQLYIKQGDQGLGKCTMIASGCVAAQGWCTAWVKKA